MTLPRFLTVSLFVVFLMSGPVAASETDEEARQNIIKLFPELLPTDIRPTPVPGLFEINIGAQITYISSDGKYLLQGDLYEAESQENLTELRRTSVRVDAIENIGESSMIVFEPTEVKHTITVFTDIDCGYCRKLHREIDGYNERGIKVQYMFYPRSGPQTESWFKAENVWCAEDRNAALTSAKAGAKIDAQDCGSTPVAQHYRLGQTFGIRGTPAIVVDTGELIGGYLPPDELARQLEN